MSRVRTDVTKEPFCFFYAKRESVPVTGMECFLRGLGVTCAFVWRLLWRLVVVVIPLSGVTQMRGKKTRAGKAEVADRVVVRLRQVCRMVFDAGGA